MNPQSLSGTPPPLRLSLKSAATQPAPRCRISAHGLLLLLACGCFLPGALRSQPAATGLNRVLQLDGTNSYVQLPSNIFDSLTQATVEGWVRWDVLRQADRLFDFGEIGRAHV